MIITLEITHFELEIILKSLSTEACRYRANRYLGVSDTLAHVVNQIEAQVAVVKKAV